MKYLLIVNPKSGKGTAPERVDAVVRYFRRHGHEVDVRLTNRPGHAVDIAAAACSSGYHAIVGCGGDGTINEVLNGMTGSNCLLGILPWGTGNVFAAEMGLPTRLRAACRLIRKGSSARFDHFPTKLSTASLFRQEYDWPCSKTPARHLALLFRYTDALLQRVSCEEVVMRYRIRNESINRINRSNHFESCMRLLPKRIFKHK